VRSYVFLFAATAAAYCAFLELLRRPRLRSAAAYAIALAVTSYLHYFGFLVLVAHGTFLILNPRRLAENRGRLARWYAGSVVAALSAYLPWARIMADRLSVQSYWIKPTHSEFYAEYFH
jgi:uncharacterized membrane protein